MVTTSRLRCRVVTLASEATGSPGLDPQPPGVGPGGRPRLSGKATRRLAQKDLGQADPAAWAGCELEGGGRTESHGESRPGPRARKNRTAPRTAELAPTQKLVLDAHPRLASQGEGRVVCLSARPPSLPQGAWEGGVAVSRVWAPRPAESCPIWAS